MKFINFVEEYLSLGGTRSEQSIKDFVKICLAKLTLEIVRPKLVPVAEDIKSIFTIVSSYLDDLVDQYCEDELTNAVFCSPLSRPKNIQTHNIEQRKAAEFFEHYYRSLNFFIEQAKLLPNFNYFSDIFFYDIRQLVLSHQYSHVTFSKPEIMNFQEYIIQSSYSMAFMIFNDIDLMCVQKIKAKEIAVARDLAFLGQNAIRLANDLATWKKEAQEAHFNSSVYFFLRQNFKTRPPWDLNDAIIIFNRERVYKVIQNEISKYISMIDEIAIRSKFSFATRYRDGLEFAVEKYFEFNFT